MQTETRVEWERKYLLKSPSKQCSEYLLNTNCVLALVLGTGAPGRHQSVAAGGAHSLQKEDTHRVRDQSQQPESVLCKKLLTANSIGI